MHADAEHVTAAIREETPGAHTVESDMARLRAVAGRLEGNQDLAHLSEVLGRTALPMAGRFEGVRFTPGERAVKMMQDAWSQSTEMHADPHVVAMRMAIRDEFGRAEAVTAASDQVMAEARALYAEAGAGLRALARAQYDETQAWFAARGIRAVTVYRGRAWASDPGLGRGAFRGGGRALVSVHTASSYSSDPYEAAVHAGNPNDMLGSRAYHLVVSDRVPVGDIWSTGATGFGSSTEAEVVLLGDTREMASYGWRGNADPSIEQIVGGLAGQYAKVGAP